MSANFYDVSGKMVGVDMHKYWAAPPPPTGHPEPEWPHAVGCEFTDSLAKDYLRVYSVTAETRPMIAGGFDVGPVLMHVPSPVPLPPHPVGEPPVLAMVIKFSTSTAQLSVDSVSGKGNALACCLLGPSGLNVNCNDPKDLPSGLVTVISTVKTSPTLGDLIGFLVGFHLNRWFNKKLGDRFKRLGERGINWIKAVLRFLGDFAKWLNKYLGMVVDWIGTASSFATHVVNAIAKYPERFLQWIWDELHHKTPAFPRPWD